MPSNLFFGLASRAQELCAWIPLGDVVVALAAALRSSAER